MTRPALSSQSRTRGLVPRFRYGYTDQHIRVSDAERTEVADRLAAHFAEGRLNHHLACDESDDVCNVRVVAAQQHGELRFVERRLGEMRPSSIMDMTE